MQALHSFYSARNTLLFNRSPFNPPASKGNFHFRRTFPNPTTCSVHQYHHNTTTISILLHTPPTTTVNRKSDNTDGYCTASLTALCKPLIIITLSGKVQLTDLTKRCSKMLKLCYRLSQKLYIVIKSLSGYINEIIDQNND